MDAFTAQIGARIAAARTALAAAVAEGDDYRVAVREGELESLTRLASANDVDVTAHEPLPDATLHEQRRTA